MRSLVTAVLLALLAADLCFIVYTAAPRCTPSTPGYTLGDTLMAGCR